MVAINGNIEVADTFGTEKDGHGSISESSGCTKIHIHASSLASPIRFQKSGVGGVVASKARR